jgi:hypothetical protein
VMSNRSTLSNAVILVSSYATNTFQSLSSSFSFSCQCYSSAQATAAATNPLPTKGFISPAAAAGLSDEPAGCDPDPLAPAFVIGEPDTPVAFWHWSSARRWAEELKVMSAHYVFRQISL